MADTSAPRMTLDGLQRRIGQVLTAALLRERPETMAELPPDEWDDLEVLDQLAHALARNTSPFYTARALANPHGTRAAAAVYGPGCDAWDEYRLRRLARCPASQHALWRLYRHHHYERMNAHA